MSWKEYLNSNLRNRAQISQNTFFSPEYRSVICQVSYVGHSFPVFIFNHPSAYDFPLTAKQQEGLQIGVKSSFWMLINSIKESKFSMWLIVEKIGFFFTAGQQQSHNPSLLPYRCRQEQCREKQIINHTHTAYSIRSDAFSSVICAQPRESLTTDAKKAEIFIWANNFFNKWVVWTLQFLTPNSGWQTFWSFSASVWEDDVVFVLMSWVTTACFLIAHNVVWAAEPQGKRKDFIT